MSRKNSRTWDERYNSPEYFYGTAPNEFLRSQADALSPGGRILCLGEGEGRNAVFLAQRGFVVTALDQSARGLGKARSLASANGAKIDTVHADLAHYAIEVNRWDGIVSIWCHLPSPLRARVHHQIGASLRPGGVFLLEAYTPDQLHHRTGGPSDVDMLPTLPQLQRELDGLTFIQGREALRHVHEGVGHNGLSAVVQIVARRQAQGIRDE